MTSKRKDLHLAIHTHTDSELNLYSVCLVQFQTPSMRADRTVKQELNEGQRQPGIGPKSTHSHPPKPQLRCTATLETIFQQKMGQGPVPHRSRSF